MMVKASKIALACGILLAGTATAQQKQTYIVHMRPTEAFAKRDHIVRRDEIGDSIQAAAVDPAAIIYTYNTTLNGFAATLSDTQAQALNAQPEVLSVTVEKVFKLHTTRTPKFLGIVDSDELFGKRSVEYSGMPVRRDVNAAEANVIIAVLDTGAWPENPSYDDTGMPDLPDHWKGSCEEGDQWTTANCNKKLIGAGAFYQGYVAYVEQDTGLPFNWTGSSEIQSTRDTDGHGTHTSTTIAGARTANASLFGDAAGTAQGMAADARLAIYKICWALGCFESDILAAMDKAIADGVNVISGSFGGGPSIDPDALNVGTFAATEAGILTSFSAGNSGPDPETVVNNPPWILTIAASTLDRDFPATVILGDGRNFTGVSLYANGAVDDVEPLLSSEYLPMILSSEAGSNVSDATLCLADSLTPSLVAGKVVVCTRGNNGRAEKAGVVKAAGGRAMVLVNPPSSGEEIVADAHILPALHIGAKDGAEIIEYAKSANATAALDFEGTRLGVPAPVMAAFSSRGPNLPVLQILKPDITGPGVDILAGWTALEGPSGLVEDTRVVDYNVISGTSMSCPHLSGIAAYIIARHPEWSISAVRSAIMTTAYTTTKGTVSPLIDSATSTAATPFDYGNGHVDPVAALDPGLVYEITTEDYREFICSVDTSEDFVVGMTRSNYTCGTNTTYSAYNLNYPSFAAYYDTSVSKGTYKAKLPRTVTNVGTAGTYSVSVQLADEDLVKVSVEPETLTFTSPGQKQEFTVTVEMSKRSVGNESLTSYGRLEWTDGTHTVGSSLGFIWG